MNLKKGKSLGYERALKFSNTINFSIEAPSSYVPSYFSLISNFRNNPRTVSVQTILLIAIIHNDDARVQPTSPSLFDCSSSRRREHVASLSLSSLSSLSPRSNEPPSDGPTVKFKVARVTDSRDGGRPSRRPGKMRANVRFSWRKHAVAENSERGGSSVARGLLEGC